MEEQRKQILLTFVVPCYNVEKYIQRCLDSIYSCGLPEDWYEIVCINDCSPDNVQVVLEHNKALHDNLRIIVHDKNKGLGGGRNTGIREARGKYLWFVDSDDDIIGDDVVDLLERAFRNNLDIVCFNYRRVDNEGNEIPLLYYFGDSPVQDGVSFAKTAFEGGITLNLGYVWRFLYRTEFLRLHQLYFPENVCWEDTVFMPKAILDAKRVSSSAAVLYSYRVNDDSISGTFSRTYSAKLLFEFAFCSGGDLLRFSEEVEDEKMKKAFHESAVQRYINGFPIPLFRTSKSERKKFYQLTKDRSAEVKPLKQEMVLLCKLLLLPVIGPTFAEIGSLVYGVTHK